MGGHHIVAYLISLAVGYWVLTLASKEEKSNRTIGQVIGWAIIVVSLFGVLCLGACKLMACHSGMGSCDTSYSCPYSGGKMGSCPDMKSMDGKDMMHGHEGDPSAPVEGGKKPAAK